MPRILAIDYGLKRTGVAVTDPLQIIASGLTTVPTHTIMDWLKTYCQEEEVEAFVVGLPLYPDGNPAQISDEVDRFVVRLQSAFPDKPVHRQDERFSSVSAKQVILDSGIKKQKRKDKALVDKIAAAIILEQYMLTHVWDR
jgi:putative holliday junction resolvase